jgi:hypothetical protein
MESPNEILTPWYDGETIEWITPPEYYSRLLGNIACTELDIIIDSPTE